MRSNGRKKPVSGNAVLAQSGGPTAVINSSISGVIEQAQKSQVIKKVYGANNGILGILQEDFFDIGKESKETLKKLKTTPAAAIGSCRHKLKSLSESARDFKRVLTIFKAHNIRFFFYNGGNDSMDTAAKIQDLSKSLGWDMQVMGVPKTIDNDLAFTDHSPGYGSVAKFIATSAAEAGRDTEALSTHEPVCIIEAMGRNAGWIAAAGALARLSPEDAPHMILLPEIPFSEKKFLLEVRKNLKKYGRCFIVASEGARFANGKYLGEAGGAFGKDAFGHAQLGGTAETLRAIIEKRIKVKARTIKPGQIQRAAIHFGSKTDRDEAFRCGIEAVKAAERRQGGHMVAMVRRPGKVYQIDYRLIPLKRVANAEHVLPKKFIAKNGFGVTPAFINYARPLVQGEVRPPINLNGIPDLMRFKRVPVKKIVKTPFKI